MNFKVLVFLTMLLASIFLTYAESTSKDLNNKDDKIDTFGHGGWFGGHGGEHGGWGGGDGGMGGGFGGGRGGGPSGGDGGMGGGFGGGPEGGGVPKAN